MATFYPLTVTDIHHDTRDSVVVTLIPAPADAQHFKYIQGQYLTFRKSFDGEELRRCYSICAGREEQLLRVGIKKDPGGTFSSWANEQLHVGDVLESLAPMGRFHAPIEPDKPKSYLLFAGGSGITPVLGLLKTIMAEEPLSSATLVYGNRSANSVMFREELEDLKNTHLGRLSILHILEHDASEIELFTGRLDSAKCEALFDVWIDVARTDMAFICGPEPMMLAISGALKTRGLDESRIKYELFAASKPVKNRRPQISEAATGGQDQCAITVVLDGTARTLSPADRDVAVLDAVLAEKLDVPHSCKAGVCSSCRALVVEGEVDMIANHALEDYEVRQGYVLTCQSYPLSDRLVIDYDK